MYFSDSPSSDDEVSPPKWMDAANDIPESKRPAAHKIDPDYAKIRKRPFISALDARICAHMVMDVLTKNFKKIIAFAKDVETEENDFGNLKPKVSTDGEHFVAFYEKYVKNSKSEYFDELMKIGEEIMCVFGAAFGFYRPDAGIISGSPPGIRNVHVEEHERRVEAQRRDKEAKKRQWEEKYVEQHKKMQEHSMGGKAGADAVRVDQAKRRKQEDEDKEERVRLAEEHERDIREAFNY